MNYAVMRLQLKAHTYRRSYLVLTKLDYGSATLAGLPAVQLDRLQSVLNIRGKKCLPVRPSVRTSVRPQKVSSI